MSIESGYLQTIANHVKSDVDNVLINNTTVITAFQVDTVTANVYEIRFLVDTLITSVITNIKIRDINNNVISSNNVNIPILDESAIRQTFTISEVL